MTTGFISKCIFAEELNTGTPSFRFYPIAPLLSQAALAAAEPGPTPMIEITVINCGKGVDAQPVLVTSVGAEKLYPIELLRQGIDGTAVIEGIVNVGGRFDSVAGIEASDPLFLRAAVEGANLWLFIPAKRSGAPVACPVKCKVRFTRDWD